MRNVVVGIVIGCVVGIMLGATIIAPRMNAARTDRAPRPAGSETLNAPPPKKLEPRPKAMTQTGEAQTGEAQTERILKFASAFSPREGVVATQIADFGDRIKRISGGGLRLFVQAPGAPIAPVDYYDAISAGVLDGAFIDPGLWSDRAPALALFSTVPFGPDMTEFSAWYAAGGGREGLADIAQTLSVHALACGIAPGEAAGWSRTPITSARDLSRLRIAARGLSARVLERARAHVFDMAPSDALTALKDGVLNAVQISRLAPSSLSELARLDTIYYFPGWQKPATFITLMIRKGAWDALSPTRRAQIEAACTQSFHRGLTTGGSMQLAELKAVTGEDIPIRRLPRSALDALKKAWRAIAREEASKDETFAKLWRTLSEFREDYEIWHEMSASRP